MNLKINLCFVKRGETGYFICSQRYISFQIIIIIIYILGCILVPSMKSVGQIGFEI